MGMTFRTTDEGADVYDETGKIGVLYHADADEEDPSEGWQVVLWGFELGTSRYTGYYPTAPEAVEAARPLYEKLLEYRRHVARIEGRHRFILTPMGGQPK